MVSFSILIVDDEAAARQQLKNMLKDKYEIDMASNGKDALAKLKKSPVDIVLLDIQMPRLDGLEVLKRIKMINPKVEVIMVTIIDKIDVAVAAVKLGASSYITKPVNEERLHKALNESIEIISLDKNLKDLKEKIKELK